jgi:hypothetical protein
MSKTISFTPSNLSDRISLSKCGKVELIQMIPNLRSFDAGPVPFGRTWHVEFRWLQTGISIRPADTVDVKFEVSSVDEGSFETIRV